MRQHTLLSLLAAPAAAVAGCGRGVFLDCIFYMGSAAALTGRAQPSSSRLYSCCITRSEQLTHHLRHGCCCRRLLLPQPGCIRRVLHHLRGRVRRLRRQQRLCH